MKQLKCEMCGSTDIVKQDGVFVCQSCGTKYSVEEAKKMMIEGSVDVSGSTVKVDTSEELDNLYKMATRARQGADFEGAAKYYELILFKNANSWEAVFYAPTMKALAEEKKRVITQGSNRDYNQIHLAILDRVSAITNAMTSAMKLINKITSDEEKLEAVKRVAKDVRFLIGTEYKSEQDLWRVYSAELKQLYADLHVEKYSEFSNTMYLLGDTIDDTFNGYDELHTESVSAWKSAIEITIGLKNYYSNPAHLESIIQEYEAKIQKYEPEYSAYKKNNSSGEKTFSSGTKEGNCYIATAVYGSYNCPQVWTLRRYRDYSLASTLKGRLFIRIYYLISPYLVKWFGQTEWFKKRWKSRLDRMVKDLQNKGFASTPYKDKSW